MEEEQTRSEEANEVETKIEMACNSKQEENGGLRTFIKGAFLQQGNVNEIVDELNNLISPSKPRNKNLLQDKFNAISLAAQNIKGYLRLLNDDEMGNLLETTNDDTSKFISNLFGIDNGYMHFHDIQSQGLLRVCKLALYLKFTKYATDGCTALYTRPPVIYISGAAPAHFGKELRSQLGLPQSSICKVPCNTMFGSSYTMDVAAFERLLTDDVSCGKTPLVLIAYAGTPSTGHADNLSRLREICTQSGVWLHIEGDSLATLALKKVPPSVAPATSADSLTLKLPNWFGATNIPFCTSYKTPNYSLAESSDLVPKHIIEKLTCLPLWMLIKSTGSDQLRNIIINAAELAQQLSHRIDMISGIKRLEQSNVTSPTVVFKYKASPTISYSSSNSLEDDEEDDSPSHVAVQAAGTKTTIDVSPKLCDAMNQILAEKLQKCCEKVEIEVTQVLREGCCMLFSPLRSARALGTGNDDIDQFVEDLEREIMKLDSTLISRNFFDEAFHTVSDLHLIDSSEEPVVGSFQCIPKYWKVKDMSNLSDSKKREANDLNNNMLGQLSKEFDYLSEGKTAEGQMFIRIGVVDESFDLHALSERVQQLAEELEDNSKFLESLSDAVQKSIHEAEAVLQRESEEKFFEEGVLRHVPLIGSVFSWLSPPAKESHGVTGRAFNLASGKLKTTERTYKYKMQLQNDDDEDAVVEENAAQGSSQNSSTNDEKKIDDETQNAAEENADVNVEEPSEGAAENDVKEKEIESQSASHGDSDSNVNEATGEATSNENSTDKPQSEIGANTSSNDNEVGEEVKESDV